MAVRHAPAIEGGAPVRDRFLPFGLPSITEAEIQEVVDTLRSGWIGTGPKVKQFEEEFAAFVQAPNAVAVNSCTAALHLSLLVSGCGPGSEVITSDLTFVATTNAVLHAGGTPVLADVDPISWNVTAATIEPLITERTKAILPVHFGGLPCELDEIYTLAAAHDLVVIEDCAHAVGSEYRGRVIGSSPGLSCFSFYANKNVTTAEGGMITTPSAEAAGRLGTWRLHGLDRDAWERYRTRRLLPSSCTFPGFKYNMPDLAASLGLHQLRRLPSMLITRERYAGRLDALLDATAGVRRQPRPSRERGRHALHLYALVIDPTAFTVGRDHIVGALRAENVGAAIHYEPVHRHAYYKDLLRMDDAQRPAASHIGSNILTLPLTPAMSEADLADVAEAVQKVLTYYRR